MNFKYHNVLLPNGRWTVPGTISLKRTPVFQVIADYLYEKYTREQRKKMTVLDIGSLEGGYAVLLAQMGFKVTMIEAREENIQKSKEMARLNGMNIEILAGDAKEILRGNRKWDIVLCAGLLYHLDNPVEFFDLMKSCANESLIVSTHYSLEDDNRYELPHPVKRVRRMVYKRLPWLFKKAEHSLSALTRNETYRGRWYREYEDNSTQQEIEKSTLASYSNPKSFWLTLGSLFCLANRSKKGSELLRQDNKHHSICLVSYKD